MKYLFLLILFAFNTAIAQIPEPVNIENSEQQEFFCPDINIKIVNENSDQCPFQGDLEKPCFAAPIAKIRKNCPAYIPINFINTRLVHYTIGFEIDPQKLDVLDSWEVIDEGNNPFGYPEYTSHQSYFPYLAALKKYSNWWFQNTPNLNDRYLFGAGTAQNNYLGFAAGIRLGNIQIGNIANFNYPQNAHGLCVAVEAIGNVGENIPLTPHFLSTQSDLLYSQLYPSIVKANSELTEFYNVTEDTTLISGSVVIEDDGLPCGSPFEGLIAPPGGNLKNKINNRRPASLNKSNSSRNIIPSSGGQ
ncbi:hypothetical protein N9N67_02770 [Bacteriovoracaceae bacterium]|nr:hypothetical protein [Bacteriovoracaceae bacterium]